MVVKGNKVRKGWVLARSKPPLPPPTENDGIRIPNTSYIKLRQLFISFSNNYLNNSSISWLLSATFIYFFDINFIIPSPSKFYLLLNSYNFRIGLLRHFTFNSLHCTYFSYSYVWTVQFFKLKMSLTSCICWLDWDQRRASTVSHDRCCNAMVTPLILYLREIKNRE